MSIVKRLLSGEIKGVFIDSRKPLKDGLFVPIVGEKFNGNSFVLEALDQGAKAALVERSYFKENEKKFRNKDIYIVEDSLEALQFLARELRDEMETMIIGITGSNGKTTTKNMLRSICEQRYRTHATLGNFNNEIGMPLTLLNVPLDTEVLILEMGMSQAGEIAELVRIARPTIGVITNIGTSHMEHFGNQEAIRDAKLEITRCMGKESILILNGDDPFLADYAKEDFQVIKTYLSEVENLRQEEGYYSFDYGRQRIQLKMRGAHNVKNALLAIKAAQCLCIPEDQVKRGLEQCESEPMRFTEISLGEVRLINDAYNASPMSMRAALDTLMEIPAKRHIAVLGDMFELGENSRQDHQKLGECEAIMKLDALFTVGEDARYISESHPNSRHFGNLTALNQHLKSFLRAGDLVLIKASRGMELERTVQYLKEKLHA